MTLIHPVYIYMTCYSPHSHIHNLSCDWSDELHRLWQLPFDFNKGSSIALYRDHPILSDVLLRSAAYPINAFSKSIKYTKTGFWNFLHFCSNTFVKTAFLLLSHSITKTKLFCPWYLHIEREFDPVLFITRFLRCSSSSW